MMKWSNITSPHHAQTDATFAYMPSVTATGMTTKTPICYREPKSLYGIHSNQLYKTHGEQGNLIYGGKVASLLQTGTENNPRHGMVSAYTQEVSK